MTVVKSPVCAAASIHYVIGEEGVHELKEVSCSHATATKPMVVRTDLSFGTRRGSGSDAGTHLTLRCLAEFAASILPLMICK